MKLNFAKFARAIYSTVWKAGDKKGIEATKLNKAPRSADAELKEVTIFCAVWHKDPNRHALLQSHRENLRRQTVPVEIIYVFDGGDPVPTGLEARTITSSDPLSIFQAWNLALAGVRTPLAMNLNLDDRLAPDAVEILRAELNRSGAMLIGGDWRICFSREETDAVSLSFPAASLSPVLQWPPPRSKTARLGNTCVLEGGIYGPAVMWQMVLHRVIPRYPWRFSDDSLVRGIADGIFWRWVANRGGKRVKLPLIIGNYHSHPDEQAEFRHDSAKEWQAASTVGVMVI